jgi:hypothetical protein
LTREWGQSDIILAGRHHPGISVLLHKTRRATESLREIEMHRLAIVAVFAAMLAVICLVFEAGARWYVSWGLGIASSDYVNFYHRSTPNRVLLTWAERYERHPYIGYGRPDVILEMERFRNERDPNEYVIAILGGSVAEHFGNYIRVQYFEPLRELIPEMGDRRIRVLNLALGGYKQPQQFFLASYLVEDLDMTLNIDGFNEMAIRDFFPLYPADFPATALKFYERSSQGRIYMIIARCATFTYRVLNWLPARLPLLARSGAYFLTWRGMEPLLSQTIEGFENRYLAALGVSTSEGDKNRSVSWERKLEIWKKYTILQGKLMRLSGVPAYFFLQPNQYLKGAKPLSKEEWSIAINPDRVYTGNAEMQLLRSAAQDMQAEGLPIYDLTGIFRGIAKTVYEDACCHLNELGNQIMAKVILEAIRLELVANTPTSLNQR